MERKPLLKRLLAGTLAVAVAASSLTFTSLAADDVNGTKLSLKEVSNDAVSAAIPGRETMSSGSEKAPYADNESVRVSIVLDDKSTIANGFEVKDIAQNTAAMSYRAELQAKQNNVVTKIEKATGEDLDVVWKLTLAANLISANVEYGQIEAIEKISGVKEVLIETQYQPDVISEKPPVDPNMATSSTQIGSGLAWAAGYTGAGSRIAIVDTGTDTDHQSFAEAGFLHSLEVNAEKKGMTVEAYMATLNLLTKEEINSVKDQLNVGKGDFKQDGGAIDPEKAYLTQKLPYAFCYVDNDYDVTHDNDTQGEHGSHVAGIATANSYIKTDDGFEPALTYAHTQGVAPDAQLLTMKVFGNGGGAYDSDYMAAIEDAIVLKADSINLSLGSGNPGRSRCSTAAYQAIMESLTESGVVVAMSAGNSGHWAEEANNLTGNLYADDVSMQTDGSPGSYTNSFTVASIDNIGFTGTYLEAADGSVIFYNESPSDDGYASITTLKGEQPYILIEGYGTPEDWTALKDVLEGKIAVCSRGDISFVDKGNNAVMCGASATIVYNNTSGTINMSGDGYNYKAPYLSITQADGAILMANAEKKTTADGYVYYEGTLVSHDEITSTGTNSGSTMSDFSSWGVPGSLQLKPEITAPGGDIYSVNGAVAGGTSYENMSGTSMASPQIAGLSAVAAQYVREKGLEEKTSLSARTLIQSLLMSTATPVFESVAVDVDEATGDYIYGDFYYPVIRQGAGLANITNLINAASYILMGEDATVSANDGKVKAELGDDPDRKGKYTFSFSINNITDEPVAYNLSADLFTQNYYVYYANGAGTAISYYMDTATMDMDADAVFECDGETVTTVMVPANGSTTVTVTLTLSEDQKAELDEVFENGAYVEGFVYASPAKSYDFNNDGKVDEDDAKAILDYRTTVSDKLYNAENADFDDNGEIDTRDAYLFLEALANGDIDFGEGVEGVTHSIPVLGFYGNWSDPSMLDVGSYLEYASGEETRDPYLGNKNVNSFGITYMYTDGDDGIYYFGGNPVFAEKYDENRNAMNANDIISMVSFAAIRNAEASYFRVLKDGEVVTSTSLGKIDAAFYYANQGAWYYTSNDEDLNIVPANYGLENNDKITLDLVLVPEYYVDSEGNVALDELGEGAHMSVPLTIDNVKPNVVEATYDEKTHTINVTANDNNYVAGVLLFNRSGTTLLDYDRAKSDIDTGADAVYSLDVEGVKGKEFIIQVIDYANNIRTYICDEEVGSDIAVPDMMAIDTNRYGESTWTSIVEASDTAKTAQVYLSSNYDFVAATIVEHYIFAVTNSGELYVMPEDDLDNFSKVGDMSFGVYDMAYNPADGEIYGLTVMYGSSVIFNIDKLTGDFDVAYYLPDLAITLACDENGVFYYNPVGTDTVKAFTLDGAAPFDDVEAEEICSSVGIGESDTYNQAMEINPNNGILSWVGINADREAFYAEIDPETGDSKVYDFPAVQLYSLVIPDKTPASGTPEWAEPTDTALDIVISDESIEMFKNGTTQLTAEVLPWTLTDRSVKWSSSDPTVAAVSADGTVTALKAGECTITASSSATPSVKATCDVTVSNISVTVSGVLQDTEGKAQFFEWNMETDETWTGGNKLSLDGEIASATASDKYVYIGTSKESYYQIDPATGANLDQGSGSFGAPYADLAYSTFFSTEDKPLSLAVAEYFVLGPSDPVNPEPIGWNLGSYLAQYTGSTSFVAVASMGYVEFESQGVVYDAEQFAALTNNGAMWFFFLKADPETGEPMPSIGLDFYDTNMPSNFLGSNSNGEYCSMVYGADGYLYLSAWDGDTNNFYRIEIDDEEYECYATYMGNVGKDVWPAALLKAESNEKAVAAASISIGNTSSHKIAAGVEAENISAEDIATAKATRSVKPAKHVKTVTTASAAEKNTRSANGAAVLKHSAAILSDDQTEEVTDNNAEGGKLEATLNTNGKENGLIIVNYDADLLSFNKAENSVDLESVKVDNDNGKLIFAYVNKLETVEAMEEDQKLDVVLQFSVKEGAEITETTTPIDVIFAEVDSTNIIPPVNQDGDEISVADYDPAKDGIVIDGEIVDLDSEEAGEFVKEDVEVELPEPEPPVSESDESEPPVSEPDESKSDESEPPVSETDESKPDESEPLITVSDESKPGESEPSVSEPEVSVSDESKPSVSEPEVSEPSNTSSTSGVVAPGNDDNKPTGLVFCLVPAAVSAIAVIASKKRRK